MTFRSALRLSGPVLAAAFMAGCAAEGAPQGMAAADPYEPFNRTMLNANIGLDRYVLRPTSQAYDFAMPETLQFVIRNELDYISTPIDLANYLLQGNFREAGVSLARFTMNTVLGGVGFLDPATEFGLPKRETDFGITLGKWGVAEGPYLVLPLLGPMTGRDTPSLVVDRAFSPLTYLGYWGPLSGVPALGVGARFVDIVDKRTENFDLVDQLLYETEDPYVTLRSAYVQRRRAQVAGDEGSIENLPDIFEDEGEDEDEAAPAQ
jgi:phospholipid-binding lipoprotein MlaA